MTCNLTGDAIFSFKWIKNISSFEKNRHLIDGITQAEHVESNIQSI